MYTFHIKNTGPDFDFILTRALLGIAAVAALLYGSAAPWLLDYLVAAFLLLAAFFVKTLLTRYRVKRLLILVLAAVLLFIVTHSFFFAAVLVIYGMVAKNLYPKNIIQVGEEGVSLTRLFGQDLHPWEEFNQVFLKDDLLSLDFKNNKLLQLTVSYTSTTVDEKEFNNFCKGLVGVPSTL
jgi:predicted PurR-regulated permease PerM